MSRELSAQSSLVFISVEPSQTDHRQAHKFRQGCHGLSEQSHHAVWPPMSIPHLFEALKNLRANVVVTAPTSAIDHHFTHKNTKQEGINYTLPLENHWREQRIALDPSAQSNHSLHND